MQGGAVLAAAIVAWVLISMLVDTVHPPAAVAPDPVVAPDAVQLRLAVGQQIAVGTALADADRIMTASGFDCRKRRGASYSDVTEASGTPAVRGPVDILVCGRDGLADLGARWQVMFEDERGRVGRIGVGTGR